MKNEGKGRQIWITFCLAIFVALVFWMAKSFVFNSSSEKPAFKELPEAKKLILPTNTQSQADASQQQVQPQKNQTPVQEETPIEEEKTVSPSSSDKFITYSPIKISEIKKISKFRSCTDLAFGKTSFQDQTESEESSLRHYLKLKNETVTIYSPFDGKIISKSPDRLVIETNPFNGWLINIIGIASKNGLGLDSDVKSGEEIGKSTSDKIQISISGFAESQEEKDYSEYYEKNLDSFFSHLNEDISQEYSDKGIDSNNMIVQKIDRSAKCKFKPNNEEDWISLK